MRRRLPCSSQGQQGSVHPPRRGRVVTHWLTTDGPHTAEAESFARYGRTRVPAEAGDAPAGRPPVRLVERNSPNSVPSRAVRAWRASRTPAALGSVALAAGVWWVAALFLSAAALFAAFEMPCFDDPPRESTRRRLEKLREHDAYKLGPLPMTAERRAAIDAAIAAKHENERPA